MLRIGPLFELLRPKDWAKNLFIFIPVFFAGQITNLSKIYTLLAAFVAFSLTSSAVYILNDYRDIEGDRQHPVKQKRPLASGEVSKASAIVLMFFLLAIELAISYTLDFSFFVILLVYLVLNVGYSMGLKSVSILDIIIVSFGFVLRVFSGGIVADVPLSKWMIIMIFLLSLLLAFAKRRDDMIIFNHSGKILRKSISQYNLDFINTSIAMLSGVIIVSYLMYTISTEVVVRLGSDYLYSTSVFVIAGLLRYLQITFVENKSGSPTEILYTDTFIQIVLVGWVVSFYLIIYKI